MSNTSWLGPRGSTGFEVINAGRGSLLADFSGSQNGSFGNCKEAKPGQICFEMAPSNTQISFQRSFRQEGRVKMVQMIRVILVVFVLLICPSQGWSIILQAIPKEEVNRPDYLSRSIQVWLTCGAGQGQHVDKLILSSKGESKVTVSMTGRHVGLTKLGRSKLVCLNYDAVYISLYYHPMPLRVISRTLCS